MAGEIEEPFRFNFQADLLHSGSVSFGRFESESLSWERRSSFSHNRYLEEVERYSKPGSVTEKKAYFEAHFKRKALLKQSSSESQDGSENGNESKHFTCFDESPYSSGHLKYDQETESQIRVNQNIETLCAEDTNLSSVDHTVTGPDHLMLEETHQTETENVNSVKGEEITEVTLNDSVVTVGVASETVQPRPKPKANANPAQVSRIVSSVASNVSAKTKIRDIKGLTMKETVKKSPRPASSIGHSGRKTLKSEESSTTLPKTKLPPPNKSIVKEHRSEKPVPGARQTVNRTKQSTLTPSKPHVDQIASGFTLKSDQRAEGRKEEKRAAAEMSQSRKSLNFKATPMPSFYKEATRSTDQNKAMSTSKTLNRPRTASMAPSTPNRLRTASMAPSTKKLPSNAANSSNPRPSSSTSSSNRNRLPEPSRRVQEKKKDLNLQNGTRVRDTNGVHAGTGLKLGYIAVGVAT